MPPFDFPSSPTEAQEFTPPGGVTYVYYAPVWKVKPVASGGGGGGSSIFIGETAPSSPIEGQTWWQPSTGKSFIWYEDEWTRLSTGDPWAEVLEDGLYLDFTTGSAIVMDSVGARDYDGDVNGLLTYTAPSPKNIFDVSGVMVSGSTLRCDHDPVSHVPLGVRVEEARTNLLLNSATLATQSVTVTAVANTLSFWGTGTVTLSGAATGSLVGTGASNRVSLTFTPAAGSLTLTVAGTVSKAQLEVGAFPTSYITTTAAPVTRSADVITLPAAAFPIGSVHSLIFEGRKFGDGLEGDLDLLKDGNNVIMVRQYPAGTLQLLDVFAGGVDVLFSEAAILTANYKWGLAAAANDFAFTVNGGAVQTDNSAGVPSPLVSLDIGQINGGNFYNGWVKKVTYLPRRASNAELQTLSAP